MAKKIVARKFNKNLTSVGELEISISISFATIEEHRFCFRRIFDN